jgi:hypothetical protein
MSDLDFQILDDSGNEISTLNAGVVEAGETKSLGTITVKNNGTDTPDELFLTALLSNRTEDGTNAQGLEAVDEGWIEAREDATPLEWDDDFTTLDTDRWLLREGFYDTPSVEDGLLSLAYDAGITTKVSDESDPLFWEESTFKIKVKGPHCIYIGTCRYDHEAYSPTSYRMGIRLRFSSNNIDYFGGDYTNTGSSITLSPDTWVYVKVEITKYNDTTAQVDYYLSTDDSTYTRFVTLRGSGKTDRLYLYSSYSTSTVDYIYLTKSESYTPPANDWTELGKLSEAKKLTLTNLDADEEKEVDLRLVIPSDASTKGDFVASLELFAR